MTEAEQIKFVKEIWWNIEEIKDPSEAVQLAAVKADDGALMYIKKATLKTKLRHINYYWKYKWRIVLSIT